MRVGRPIGLAKTGGRKAGVRNIKTKTNFILHNVINYKHVEGLYIIKCIDRYKIGIANNLYQRILTLNTSNAFGIDIVNIIPLFNPRKTEKILHNVLSQKLINGKEWFLLNQNDIDILSNGSSDNIDEIITNLKKNNGYLL